MLDKALIPKTTSRQTWRNPKTPQRYVAVAKAAKRLNVSKTTIHRLRHELRYTRVRGQIQIDVDALEAYVLRNTYGRGAI